MKLTSCFGLVACVLISSVLARDRDEEGGRRGGRPRRTTTTTTPPPPGGSTAAPPPTPAPGTPCTMRSQCGDEQCCLAVAGSPNQGTCQRQAGLGGRCDTRQSTLFGSPIVVPDGIAQATYCPCWMGEMCIPPTFSPSNPQYLGFCSFGK